MKYITLQKRRLSTKTFLVFLFSLQMLFGSLVLNAQTYRYLRLSVPSTIKVDHNEIVFASINWIDTDGESHTIGSDINETAPANLDIDLGVGVEVAIGSIHMITSWADTRAPDNFTLEGSNDNSTWIVFHTETGLTVTDYRGKYATTEFVVSGGVATLILPESVTVTPATSTVRATETLALSNTTSPAIVTTPKARYTSSDESIATVVSHSGVVTGVVPGEVVITCAVDGITSTSNVTVLPEYHAPESVSVLPATAELAPEYTLQLTQTVLPANTTDTTVSWSSNNTAFATVDANGLVTAVALGTVNITATTNDGKLTDVCVLTVIAPTPAASIALNTNSIALSINQQSQLTETFTPEKTTNDSVTWSSSNTAIATIDANGLVTAISAGDAVLTVTSNDGGFTANCNISVYLKKVTGITLNVSELAVLVGSGSQITSLILPVDASDQTISWTSSDNAIATVSPNGLVVGADTGSVVITATTTDGGFVKTCDVTVTKKSILRFILMSDSHLNTKFPEDGWKTKDYWMAAPEIMAQTGSEFMFHLGDIHDHMLPDDTPVTWSGYDSTFAEANWVVWEDYMDMFKPYGTVDWVDGNHDYAGNTSEACEYFINHYIDHNNHVRVEGDNVFIFGGYTPGWERAYPSDLTLDWLEEQLIKYQGKRIFYMRHIPMQHSEYWWGDHIKTVDDCVNGGFIVSDFNATRRLAQLLRDYKIEAAFFGHWHMMENYGDHAGFPIYEVANRPLLVEIIDGEVSYQWINEPTSDDVLSHTKDPWGMPAEQVWKIAIIPSGESLTQEVYNIIPTGPLTLSSGATVNFIDVTSPTVNIDLSSLPGIEVGGKIVAINFSSCTSNAPIIQSSLPYKFYRDNDLMETTFESTDGRFHKIINAKSVNSFRFLFEIDKLDCNFTIYPDTRIWTIPNEEVYRNEVATLRDLSMDVGQLTNEFYTHTFSYTADAPKDVIPVISGVTGNSFATMNITQAQNLNGTVAERTATIQVTSKDKGLTQIYSVTYNRQADGINAAPEVNSVRDISYPLGSGDKQLIITGIGDGDEGDQTVSISASSSDLSVVSNVSIGSVSADSTAVLSYTINGAVGSSATITLTLSDNGGTDNGGIDSKDITFIVFVDANSTPTIDTVASLSHEPSDGTQSVTLTGITDGNFDLQALTVTAISTDVSIVYIESIDYTSPDSVAVLKYTIKGSVGESATIKVTVKDDGGTVNNGVDTIVVDIIVNIYETVNKKPTIDAVSKVISFEDDAEQIINLSGITDGDDDDLQTLSFEAVSSNTSLIANPVINYTSGTTATLSYVLTQNLSGTATITLKITDNGDDNNDNNGNQSVIIKFNIEVTPVNDQPTINNIADPASVESNTTQQKINLLGVSDGDDDFAQELSVYAVSSVNGVITIDSINTEAIYYTPLGNGATTVTITVQDDAGTDNGGVDSKSIMFDVVIAPTIGIDSRLVGKLMLHPNPTHGVLNISLSEGTLTQVVISDISGKAAMAVEMQNIDNSITIDVGSLENGIYLLYVKSSKGVLKTKFIVE